MSDIAIANTTQAEASEEIRCFSPPEYIKYANARDSRIKHAVDLHDFITYLQTSAGLLREMPENKIDVLVDDYLNEKGAAR